MSSSTPHNTAEVLKQTAELVSSTGLKDAGFRYINMDDCWMLPTANRTRGGAGPQQVNPDKFPDGLQPVVDHVHSIGLLFVRCIPIKTTIYDFIKTTIYDTVYPWIYLHTHVHIHRLTFYLPLVSLGRCQHCSILVVVLYFSFYANPRRCAILYMHARTSALSKGLVHGTVQQHVRRLCSVVYARASRRIAVRSVGGRLLEG